MNQRPLSIRLWRSWIELNALGDGQYRQCSRCYGRPKLAILSEDLAETGARSGILKWACDKNSSGGAHLSWWSSLPTASHYLLWFLASPLAWDSSRPPSPSSILLGASPQPLFWPNFLRGHRWSTKINNIHHHTVKMPPRMTPPQCLIPLSISRITRIY